jgi:hypothetical protein
MAGAAKQAAMTPASNFVFMLSPDCYAYYKKRTFVLIALALNMTFFSGAVQDGPALLVRQLRKRYR